ncbi:MULTISPECIES: 4-hydroxyphenylacetate 3-monooxygenase, oxygenase component [Pontibacillus]|uniref:4-hydroxyphenylacetate 3-monooxygenase, oxygenase component n=1 Tax=Pontibacillus chungwhensis TaxID=265426 RepID=A0ABY8UZ43_9BACI|nr:MULTISPECIES: 4-hydroxyphenylacetate 3-monooxygenase, oxygenase component [Pontibacillus]MCD5325534.1 4-hydroxyphenylacetate 3-monooxygenase, oxygenase component [Pontibacillus sp. HN14]WIF98643.1 4-hydroxyphenylacetate 3-monooxygenase, oxygenase component [Pontibacillus chungwhensis]
MPAITGDEYIKRIDTLQSNIWYDGERITGKLSEHRAFAGVMKSQAALYDLQHQKENMTFTCEKSGTGIGVSYLIPRSVEDVKKRREMIQEWATHNGGFMGRSPDYMNTVLTSFAASLDLLEGEKKTFPKKLRDFYEYARENDLSFTHTFISPQSNRSKLAFLDDEVTNARIVEKRDDGLVIRGAKLLATQGGITDEVIVYSNPGTAEEDQSYLFSIPTDTKGLTFVCRRSFVESDTPLSSRFDEMDTVVLFEDVVVPWERVFIYENVRAVTSLYKEGKFIPFTVHQIVSRQVIKAEFVLGVAQSMVDMINIGEYDHVQGKIAEIMRGVESLKALLYKGEGGGTLDEGGVYIPDPIPLYVAVSEFQAFYPRCMEIVQQLGASGMITLPSERDFSSDVGENLTFYLKGYEKNGKEKVALFRLAWDMAMSGFGTRQMHYERFFFGDPVKLAQNLYQMCPTERAKNRVEQFLQERS